MCKNGMTRRISIKNVLDILKMADLYADLKNLKLKAENFLYTNQKQLFIDSDWRYFAVENPKILNEILKNLLKL